MITEQIDIPAGTAGTTHQLVVQRFGHIGKRPQIYIQAALHADEIPGMACAVALRRQLLKLEMQGNICGEIILVPLANPIGLNQRLLGQDIGRFSLDDGGNFNRDFPALGARLITYVADFLTDNGERNVEIARQALGKIIDELPALTAAEHLKKHLLHAAFAADLVLDLHCDAEAAMHLYTHAGSAETFAPLAARLGAVAVLLAEISGGDPFDEALSRPWHELSQNLSAWPIPFACQSVTVELRGQNDVTPELAEADAVAIIGFLQDVGAIAGTAAAQPLAHCMPTPLAGSEPLVAPVGGILTYRCAVGEQVQAGDALADITNPITCALATVISPCDGVFFARSANRYVRQGQRLGKVAGTAAQRSGKLLGP